MSKNKKESQLSLSSEVDPNLLSGVGKFILPNDDVYEGAYCAHRVGLIWREGHGVYATKDGQTYEGEWRDDKLVEQQPVSIKFPSGEEYKGPILQDKYTGAGTYTMQNKMDICCEFEDNKPQGHVMLVDINGRVWEGKAGENDVLLLPENQFYFSISKDSGIGKLKPKYQPQREQDLKEANDSLEEEKALSDREIEKIVFAKSAKTANDVDFSESKWCQRYLRYKTMKNKISEKLKEDAGGESLAEEEMHWQRKYQKHKLETKEKRKQKKIETAKNSVVDTSLLQKFYSKEYKESCPPIRVFHPTCDWDVDNLQNDMKSEELQEELKTIYVTKEKEELNK